MPSLVQYRAAARVALALLAVACADASGPPTPGPGLRVIIETDSAALRQGGSLALAARVEDASGREVQGVQVHWKTLGSAVRIDGRSLRGEAPGAARVVAWVDGGESDTLPVDVFGHPTGVRMGRTELGDAPFGVAVSRQGVALVTQAWGGRLARLSLDPFAVIGGIDVGTVPTAVAFSQSGDTAYVTNQISGNVGVVDLATNRQVTTVPVRGDPFVVTLSPDDRTVYATQNTEWVFAIDRATHRVTDSIRVGTAPNGFAIHPNGERMYVSASWGGTITEIEIATHRVLRTFVPGGMPQGMVVSANGTELYSANESGWLDVYDLGSGQRVSRVPTAGGGFGIALSPDQAHVYVSLSNAGRVQVINLAERAVTITLDLGGVPRRIAFDYHGGNAVVANESGWVDLVR